MSAAADPLQQLGLSLDDATRFFVFYFEFGKIKSPAFEAAKDKAIADKDGVALVHAVCTEMCDKDGTLFTSEQCGKEIDPVQVYNAWIGRRMQNSKAFPQMLSLFKRSEIKPIPSYRPDSTRPFICGVSLNNESKTVGDTPVRVLETAAPVVAVNSTAKSVTLDHKASMLPHIQEVMKKTLEEPVDENKPSVDVKPTDIEHALVQQEKAKRKLALENADLQVRLDRAISENRMHQVSPEFIHGVEKSTVQAVLEANVDLEFITRKIAETQRLLKEAHAMDRFAQQLRTVVEDHEEEATERIDEAMERIEQEHRARVARETSKRALVTNEVLREAKQARREVKQAISNLANHTHQWRAERDRLQKQLDKQTQIANRERDISIQKQQELNAVRGVHTSTQQKAIVAEMKVAELRQKEEQELQSIVQSMQRVMVSDQRNEEPATAVVPLTRSQTVRKPAVSMARSTPVDTVDLFSGLKKPAPAALKFAAPASSSSFAAAGSSTDTDLVRAAELEARSMRFQNTLREVAGGLF
jgi:hypothetical protein